MRQFQSTRKLYSAPNPLPATTGSKQNNSTLKPTSPPVQLKIIKAVSNFQDFLLRVYTSSLFILSAGVFIYSASSRLYRLHKSWPNETNAHKTDKTKTQLLECIDEAIATNEIDKKVWFFLFRSRLDSSPAIKHTKELSSSATNFIATH